MSWRRRVPAPVRALYRDVATRVHRRGELDRIDLSVFDAYLPEAPVIVEAGAHVGVDTRAMARRWPKAVIHAFEPVPEIFVQLEAVAAQLPGVFCHQQALGASTGTARMWVSSGASDGSSSLLPPRMHRESHPDVDFTLGPEVATVTLDDWAEEAGVRPDLLWLDLQGDELRALESAARTLPTVRLIHTEVNLREEYEGCALYPELRAWLEQHGFHVLVEAIPPGWSQGNVLFGRDV